MDSTGAASSPRASSKPPVAAAAAAGGAASSAGDALYTAVDPSSLDLSHEELSQLIAAFRTGDADGSGTIPAALPVLVSVLTTLGIDAPHEDSEALLQELVLQEAASHKGPPKGAITAISFPVFAACMARLRE